MKTRKLFKLIEQTQSTNALSVDRAAGVIHNVKVLGLISENGRRYLPEAVQKAAGLYEGIRVNINHPDGKPTDQRSAYDRFGKLENIRWVEGEGLYGDLVYLKSHPMAERICEAAERMPDVFGLSHNAGGDGKVDKDGTFVVNEIVEVRHVDLVADPATTKSLQESRQVKTLKESNMDEKLKEALDGLKEAMGKLEACYTEAEGEEKKDAMEAEGEDEKEKETAEAEAGEKEEKKDASEAEVEVEIDGDEDEDMEEEDDNKKPMEGKRAKLTARKLLQENKALKAREAVRALCESAGLKATGQLLADLALLPKDAAQRTVNQLALAAKSAKPRSASPVLESKQDKAAGIPDSDTLFNWLQN